MADGAVAQVSPAWAVLAFAVLMALATAGACLDGVLEARSTGGPLVTGATAPLVEAARLMRQRRRVTIAADRLLWRGGGGAFLVAATLMVAVVPLGRWTVSDLPVGVVWFNAMDVVVWAAAWLTGWGSNSVHDLIGGYRFLAQALSYELPLMFALTTPAVAAGSLRLVDIVTAQSDWWFVVEMPAAFVVFCTCVLAFSLWGPFASAATGDVAGGVLAELSGPDRLVVLVGRYSLLAAGSTFAATLFLGGGGGPLLPPWAWVLVKTLAVLGALVIVARHLPLVRPERLAPVGWLVMVPLTLLQLLVVSVLAIGRA